MECSFSSQYRTLLPHSSHMPKCKIEAYSITSKSDGRNVDTSHLSSRCNLGQKIVVQTGYEGLRPFRKAFAQDCIQGGHPFVWTTAPFSRTNIQQQNASMIQSLNNSYTGATAQRVRVLPESQWRRIAHMQLVNNVVYRLPC